MILGIAFSVHGSQETGVGGVVRPIPSPPLGLG